MISSVKTKCFCSGDITKIENYELAVNDESQIWHCHHRLETHFSDGALRPVKARITQKELIALDMYYHRPPEELIFMTPAEHVSLHSKGKQMFETTRKKLSEAHKGRKHGPMPEEHRRKISEANKGKKLSEEHKKHLKGRVGPMKGKHHSEEAKEKISKAFKGRSTWNKGRHWKLVDGKRVFY